ncbi:MAG: putative efflux system, partial [Paenibacillus sp.]|nr:putative efflux system [Paenibacillus sp.]
MDRITKFSMKNSSALFIIMAILFASGLYSSTQLKVENMPDVSFPVVLVQTTYMGAPKDVMDNITEPIEEKLANLEDLDSMSSTSSDNNSTIILMFNQGVDISVKKQDIQDQIQEVSLPELASAPKVSTFGASSFASNYLVINAGDGMSQTELDKLYNDTIKQQLESLKGIDHMDVVGARDTSLDIELKADELSAYGLSPTQVTGAVRAAVAKSP